MRNKREYILKRDDGGTYVSNLKSNTQLLASFSEVWATL
jgi:hypothetical protein